GAVARLAVLSVKGTTLARVSAACARLCPLRGPATQLYAIFGIAFSFPGKARVSGGFIFGRFGGRCVVAFKRRRIDGDHKHASRLRIGGRAEQICTTGMAGHHEGEILVAEGCETTLEVRLGKQLDP